MSKSSKKSLIRLPKTLAEVFAGVPEERPVHITLADLKRAVDAAVNDSPDGGEFTLLTTPTRIRGMGVAHGDGEVCDPIVGLKLAVMKLRGADYAVLDLDD